jgi:hypothetical protein
MTLDELAEIENLSVRAQNVCRANNLLTLDDIRAYFDKYGHFIRMKNCGRKTSLDLKRLYDKYRPNDRVDEKALLASFNAHSNKNNITMSEEALRICRQNGLDTQKSFLQHFYNNSTFADLTGATMKVNDELLMICSAFIKEGHRAQGSTDGVDKQRVKQDGLESDGLMRVVSEFIQVKLKDLSVRSHNGLRLFLDSDFSYENLSKKILFNRTFDARKMRNVGATSKQELDRFFRSVERFVQELEYEGDIGRLPGIQTDLVIQNQFPGIVFPEKIAQSDSIFSILDYLISQNAIFSSGTPMVFKECFHIYQREPLSIRELSLKLPITFERISQICHEYLGQLFVEFRFIRDLDQSSLNHLGLDLDADYLLIDQPIVDRINKLSHTDFSSAFITFILGVLK